MKTTILKMVVLSLLFCSCEKFNTSAQYTYQYPDSLGDGIDVGSLEDVGMNTRTIEDAINKIYDGKFSEVHSMLIYKDNKLVLEEYFQGHAYQWDAPYHHGDLVTWDYEMPHHTMSATKSLVSSLIGIAIDQGFIESEQQSIFDYLPEHTHLANGGKEKISIMHLLAMTSGLEWKEWSAPYSSVANPCIGIWFQDKDPVSFILEMPLVNEPGKEFNYSTGHMTLLAEILRNASGLDISEYSGRFLFEPMEVDTFIWTNKFPNGVYDGNNLKITPRTMMKFGITYLNKGLWKGKRIVSEEWVALSAAPFDESLKINVPGEDSGRMGYSYTWWTKDYTHEGRKIQMYTASGFGGQHIMILPEVNTVVVFTCGNYVSKRPEFKILEKYIIPSIQL